MPDTAPSKLVATGSKKVPAESMTSPHASNAEQFKFPWKFRGLTLGQHGQVCRAVFKAIIANNLFERAAALAFHLLFALFPLILLMVTLFGLFAAHRVELQSDLLSYFADFLPPAAFQLLRTVATELTAHASGGKLTFGIVSSLWCISGTISSMISSLNLAYHAHETRPWLKVRAIAIGLSLLISILLLAALFLVLAGNHLVGRLGTGYPLHPIVVQVWKAIQWAAAMLLITTSCSLIYYCGPDFKQRGRWQWFPPGSAFGALVWLVTSFGFRTYLHFFNNYSATYGSLGAAIILLVWLYVSGLAYLIGVEINAEIRRAGRRTGF
jgi:membrane protein